MGEWSNGMVFMAYVDGFMTLQRGKWHNMTYLKGFIYDTVGGHLWRTEINLRRFKMDKQ